MIVVDSSALVAIFEAEPDAPRFARAIADAERLAISAMVAFDRYGEGIDPRARLDLADCAAYALATTLDVPLLFKGEDFAATDVRAASAA